MSGLTSRLAKLRTMASHCHSLPPRPVRVGTVLLHASSGAERAARIAAEDAARQATHAIAHVHLGSLGTTMMFRERGMAPLEDFGPPKPIPAGFKSPRRPVNGKPPR